MFFTLSRKLAPQLMTHTNFCRVAGFCLLLVLFVNSALSKTPDNDPVDKKILVHYMPWFTANANAGSWGWHWTMNAYDPNQGEQGARQIASHFHPSIGPYDSGNPQVLEYHLLLMKLSGIDGVIVDWYGLEDFRDYPILHQNTQQLIEQAERLHLSFAICYEDQTVPALVESGKLAASERVPHVSREIAWLDKNWFHLNGYVKLQGHPLLISFGHEGLSDDEWTKVLSTVKNPLTYLSEHHRRTAASGAFDWPLPKEGTKAQSSFINQSRAWPNAIPVAFPRFVDIYAEAKIHPSWGRIEDNGGKTFESTLARAFESNRPLVQIATWNDWSEGTMIEPSREYGNRDLEIVQSMRRKYVDAQFPYQPDDLRFATRLYELRQKHANDSGMQRKLDQIVSLVIDHSLPAAKVALAELK